MPDHSAAAPNSAAPQSNARYAAAPSAASRSALLLCFPDPLSSPLAPSLLYQKQISRFARNDKFSLRLQGQPRRRDALKRAPTTQPRFAIPGPSSSLLLFLFFISASNRSSRL